MVGALLVINTNCFHIFNTNCFQPLRASGSADKIKQHHRTSLAEMYCTAAVSCHLTLQVRCGDN